MISLARHALFALCALPLLASGCRGGGGSRTPAPGTPAATSASATATPAGAATATGGAAASATAAASPTAESGLARCRPSQLRATASYQGATGALGGAVTVTNASQAPCTVEGQPLLTLLDGQGGALAVRETAYVEATPSAPAPVTLAPGAAAFVSFIWRNWCNPAPPGPLSFSIALPWESGDVPAPIAGSTASSVSTPRCDTQSPDSEMAVSVFQAETGQ